MIAQFDERIGAGLIGDKTHSVVFDNSKIKRLVPSFRQRIPFHEGMRMGANWISEHPEEKRVDAKTNELVDRLIAAMAAVHP